MQLLKQISSGLLVVSVVFGVLLFANKTYGYSHLIRPAFYLLGGIGLILSLIASRKAVLSGEYNILFWLGNLIVFAGLVMKTYGQTHAMIIVFAGLGISMIAYFYNPFGQRDLSKDDPESPLDQL